MMQARKGLFERLADKGCVIQGWLLGWAAMIFGSALLVAAHNRLSADLIGLAYDGFEVADAVPPAGKLGLGAVYAGLLYGCSLFRSPRMLAPIAGAFAFAAALTLPIAYYPAEIKSGRLWFGHVTCGALGGLVGHLVAARCKKRRAHVRAGSDEAASR